ncbi:MAG: hypothetical protein J5542_02210 [Bacteroidales bacterium]|nr:hypothetical protein [Bacteroidales bacterium]
MFKTSAINKFSSIVPLRYDTVYYMESIDNEDLNHTMRQLKQAGPLFRNAEMLPFPIKLQYVSQKDLDSNYLRAQLNGTCDADDLNDTIDNLRQCFSADTGGSLIARCLPSFSYDDVMEDDSAVCSYPEFRSTSPEDAVENAKSFARFVAEENFERLSGESYYTFQQAKEDAKYPRRSYGGGYGMGFIVRLPDPKKITDDMQRRASELDDIIKELTENDDDFADELLSVFLMRRQGKGKYKKVYPVVVERDRIYIKISEEKRKHVVFRRAGIAKTLYIFFLRQIEKANKNHSEPIYISKAELVDYKKELISIYERISRWATKDNNDERDIENIIESLYDKTKSNNNEFNNALSSIRDFFKNEFDVNAIKEQINKCYTVEKMGKDKFGNDAYGINLDPEDFDLGMFSIDRLKV